MKQIIVFMESLNETRSNKREIKIILLSFIISVVIFHVFDLIDYFVYLNPELEWFLLLFTFLFLGSLVGSVIPYSLSHSLIVSTTYFVYFVIQFNLRRLFFASWEINILYTSLSFGGYALTVAFVSVGVRWVVRKIRRIIKEKNSNKNNIQKVKNNLKVSS